MSDQESPRVLLARGNLTGTGGAQAAPASAATITLYDSTVADIGSAHLDGVVFNRIQINLISSADSGANGVVISSSFDRGANFDTQESYTYRTANGATTYDYLMRGGHLKVAYTNSAAVLTVWRFEIFGLYDRSPGVS